MKPSSPNSRDVRAELDDLLRKVIDRINQDPSKAAIILTEWTARAGKTAKPADHPSYRKKAA